MVVFFSVSGLRTVILCVTTVKTCAMVLGMKVSYIEIAKAGMCTEGAVRAAVSTKRLECEDLGSVLVFVLAARLKAVGIEFLDEFCGIKTAAELVEVKPSEEQKMMEEIGYIPMEE